MQLGIIYDADNNWIVKYDGKISDRMQWDEMLALVASITMPEHRPCLQWLKSDFTTSK